MQAYYWLILFVAALIVEIATMGLTSIWFAGGALAAWITALLGFGTAVQIAVFVIVSIILLVLTRPYAVKYFNKDRVKTNAESLIGQYAVVVEDIDTLKAVGRVEIQGLEWAAKTEEPDGKIEKDSIVVIREIKGVTLIVSKKEDK